MCWYLKMVMICAFIGHSPLKPANFEGSTKFYVMTWTNTVKGSKFNGYHERWELEICKRCGTVYLSKKTVWKDESKKG